LKLVYLVVSRLFAWMCLSVSDSTAEDVEILMLRHQLAVAQRRDPRLARKLTWADRAWLALLAGVLPVWEILKAAGVDPAPSRDTGPTWAEFLRSQAEALLACDFVVVDLIDGSKAYVLAVIEHATRRVRVLGATLHPTCDWVVQQARNMVMDLEDTGLRVKFLLHDRDASFGAAFDAVFATAGTEVI
jgi:hypothetical protein